MSASRSSAANCRGFWSACRSTLELDTGVTSDGHLVVLHDRTISGAHCIDTAPAFPGDPKFPYVGKLVHDLALAQIKTLDCGSRPGRSSRTRSPCQGRGFRP